MKCLFVFCVVLATVYSEKVFESNGEPIEIIEKSLGPTSLSFHAGESSDAEPTPQDPQRNAVEDLITNVIESFRDVIINGNEELPPLDPLVVDAAGPFEYRDSGMRAVINAHNVRLEGLRWYVVDYVNFNLLRLGLGLHMTVPWINFSSGYDASVRLALFITHNAGGNMRVFIHRLEIGTDLRLGTNIFGGGHLILRELAIKIDVGDVQIRIDGLTGSSLVNALINSYVQNLTRDIIQEQLGDLSRELSVSLFDTINDILSSYTLDDLLGGSKIANNH